MRSMEAENEKLFSGLREEMDTQIKDCPYIVFLCGPSPSKTEEKASSKLRTDINSLLKEEGFQVIMGEDAGLEKLREEYGLDAQTNEIHLLRNQDNKAIVLIADSVGSHCELGLFSWLYAQNCKLGLDRNIVSFFVIADQQYMNDESYFNQGPIAMLKEADGKVLFCDFSTFDMDDILKPLNRKRVAALSSRSS